MSIPQESISFRRPAVHVAQALDEEAALGAFQVACLKTRPQLARKPELVGRLALD